MKLPNCEFKAENEKGFYTHCVILTFETFHSGHHNYTVGSKRTQQICASEPTEHNGPIGCCEDRCM